jgi:transposase
MSSDDTVTRVSGEGPGPSPGGIAGHTNADQTSEGPSLKTGGITGSAVTGKGIKRKLDAKSYEVKYDAIVTVERGGKTKKQIALDFGIPTSTLSTWIKNSDEIKKKYLSGEMSSQRKKCRIAKFPEVEEALLKWFKNARDQNIPLCGDTLKDQARFFATRFGISENEFDCSSGWLERFKVRHNITYKKVCGESKSVNQNSNEINDWKNKLSNILKDYSPDQIYNADETGLFFRLLPDKTFEFKDVKCHGGKQSKDRLTALVCANMSGTDKLPMFVIGKSKNPRCFKNVKSLPTEYVANKKAWMTSEIFINWLHQIDKKMTKKKRSIVMIVDNCPAHPHVKGLKSMKLVFLPPNTTSVTQPMDQGVIRNLKLHYRKLVIQKKIRAIDTKTEFAINVLDALRMLNHAWSNVTSNTIANCYHHAGFQLPTDNTHSDGEDEVDDDIPLCLLFQLGLASGGVPEEYTAVDDNLVTSAKMTNDDIVEDIISSRQHNNDESDNEDEEPPSRPSMTTVFAALDTISSHLEFLQNSTTVVTHMNTVNHFIMNEHVLSLCTKQSDISSFFTQADSSSKQD